MTLSEKLVEQWAADHLTIPTLAKLDLAAFIVRELQAPLWNEHHGQPVNCQMRDCLVWIETGEPVARIPGRLTGCYDCGSEAERAAGE